jgi:cell division protein FtsI (penicillin-binding protein 3)
MSKERRGQSKYMTPGMPRAARTRAYVTGVVLSIGLMGVGYRAWGLQVEDGEHFQDLATRQHDKTMAIPPPRGQIFDAQGRALAMTANVDSVWANPRDVRDVTATADKLAALLGLDVRVLEDKLGGDNKFVWLDRHVTAEIADAVRKAKLPGIEVSAEPKRWYPGRLIGGPVIGRSDVDGRGVEGLELSMDEVLRGTQSEVAAVRDAHGHAALAEGLAKATGGADVHSSIDRTIQAMTDNALSKAVEDHHAKSGMAVVMEVKTGRVLAISNYPTFDPNSVPDPKSGARNRAVVDAFEIGSVMKVFTIASALDAGATKASDVYSTDGGSYRVGPKTIRDVHHDGALSVSDIIKRSSNVGAVKIGMRLGAEKLYAGLKRLGFGGKTNIELPGEQSGRVRDGSKWREIELATISFGYGITVTPLQMAAAMAAIGNHGVYNEPRVIDRVVGVDGKEQFHTERASRQVLRAEVADAMLPMLASVFDVGKFRGTGSEIMVPGFVCGGKTGTAHKYDPATKKYADNKYLSSFAGLAPIKDPRLAIVVIIDEPSGGDYFGGKVAGPVFGDVASQALRYLGVPGDAPLVASTTAKAASPVVVAAVTQSPIDGNDVTDSADLGDDIRRVPSFIGNSLSQSIAVAKANSVAIKFSNPDSINAESVVIRQTPEFGAPMDGAIVLDVARRREVVLPTMANLR